MRCDSKITKMSLTDVEKAAKSYDDLPIVQTRALTMKCPHCKKEESTFNSHAGTLEFLKSTGRDITPYLEDKWATGTYFMCAFCGGKIEVIA